VQPKLPQGDSKSSAKLREHSAATSPEVCGLGLRQKQNPVLVLD